jgi:hypothetical protein
MEAPEPGSCFRSHARDSSQAPWLSPKSLLFNMLIRWTAPPPGSSPHRYSFFLFEQPGGFNGKKYAPAGGKPLINWHRMRYDLDSWQKEAKLGEPLAVNYFLSN